MRRFPTTLFVLSLLLTPAVASADPVPGTYTSTDLGGQLLTGRASNGRTGIDSGFPHVLHTQSWNGSTLGTQWEVSCPISNSFTVVDNRVSGTGTVVYTQQFTGGTMTFFAGGWPWGDGTANLNTTTLISTVQFVAGNPFPVASVVNGNTSGTFPNGCFLTFAIANGNGVGETSSLAPGLMKPADYPTFLDATCGPAPANQQFGTWGDVRTITMNIHCPVPTEQTTWGRVKLLYR
jgi:hypothetical protein